MIIIHFWFYNTRRISLKLSYKVYKIKNVKENYCRYFYFIVKFCLHIIKSDDILFLSTSNKDQTNFDYNHNQTDGAVC